MKTTVFTILATTSLASMAAAGNPEMPLLLYVGITAPDLAPEWSGFYLGGAYSANTGSGDYFVTNGPSTLDHDLSGGQYGGYAGYNYQRGTMVFGGEVAYQTGDITFDWLAAPNSADVTYLLDAKVKAGFAHNKILVYGVLGYSVGQYIEGPQGGGTALQTADLTGFNYGAGVEMKLGDNMVVGIEYLLRELSGPYDSAPPGSVDVHLDSLQLRVGWQF